MLDPRCPHQVPASPKRGHPGDPLEDGDGRRQGEPKCHQNPGKKAEEKAANREKKTKTHVQIKGIARPIPARNAAANACRLSQIDARPHARGQHA